MSLLEGMELFVLRAREHIRDLQLNEGNRKNISRIVEQLDGLPLAIELAAARSANLSLADLGKRLSLNLDLVHRKIDRGRRALEGTLSWAWDSLSKVEKICLVQLTCFQDGFTLESAEQILWLPQRHIETSVLDILETLSASNLLTTQRLQIGMVRYRMLNAILEFARKKAEEKRYGENLQEIRNRHAKYYGGLFKERRIRVYSKYWATLYAERNNFIAAMQYGLPDDSMDCCRKMAELIRAKGPYPMGLELMRRFRSRTELSDLQKIEATLLHANFMFLLGKFSEAKFRVQKVVVQCENLHTAVNRSQQKERELEVEEFVHEYKVSLRRHEFAQAKLELDKIFDYAQQYRNIEWYTQACRYSGSMYISQAHYAKAAPFIYKTIALYQSQKKVESIPILYCQLGTCHMYQGHYKKAFYLYEKASEELQKRGDVAQLGETLARVGSMYNHLGSNELAKEYMLRADAIFKTLKNPQSFRAPNLNNLGLVHLETGDAQKGLAYCQESFSLAEIAGRVDLQGVSSGNMGRIYTFMGDRESAIEYLTKGIEICSRRLKPAAAAFAAFLGFVYAEDGRFDEARALYEQWEEPVRYVPLEHGLFLCYRSLFHYLDGDYDQARVYYFDASEITEQLKVTARSRISIILRKTQDILRGTASIDTLHVHEEYKPFDVEDFIAGEDIEEYFETGDLGIFSQEQAKQESELKKQRLKAKALLLLGKIELDQSSYKIALKKGEEALEITQEYNLTELQSLSLNFVGACYRYLGNIDKALKVLDSSIELAHVNHLLLSKGQAYANISNVYHDRGDLEKSAHYAHLAIGLYEKQESLGELGKAYRDLATIYSNQNLFKESLAFTEKALDIHRKVGNIRDQAECFGNMGCIFANQGKYAQSLEFFHQALTLHRKMGNRRFEGIVLGHLGTVYAPLKQYEDAEKSFLSALEIHSAIRNRLYEGIDLGNLGDLYFEQEKWEQAEDHLLRAIEICREQIPSLVGAFSASLG
ncbi:MAG: tetratricopeptide repeat protein, partial [Myxococcota bacterium]|nr:tetratricopeptide repeat protein [Myxococcota bacterium]